MRIFIACSARESVPLKYRTLASDLSTMLAKLGHKLVFGGVDTGMMGKCYMTFKYEGGKVKGIAEVHDADTLKELELDAYEVAPTTFERTKLLYDSSDIVLILPGGIGTFAELFSMLDEKRQKGLDKEIIIFNYNNFYTPLLKYIRNCHEEGFISEHDIRLLNIVTDIKSLEFYLKKLEKRK